MCYVYSKGTSLERERLPYYTSESVMTTGIADRSADNKYYCINDDDRNYVNNEDSLYSYIASAGASLPVETL